MYLQIVIFVLIQQPIIKFGCKFDIKKCLDILLQRQQKYQDLYATSLNAYTGYYFLSKAFYSS